MKKMLVLYVRVTSQLVVLSHALYLEAYTSFDSHLRSRLRRILIAEHKWFALVCEFTKACHPLRTHYLYKILLPGNRFIIHQQNSSPTQPLVIELSLEGKKLY